MQYFFNLQLLERSYSVNKKFILLVTYNTNLIISRCAHDKYLLQNLDYVSDLMVGKEAHVYKYADRPSIFFDCKITLTIKEPGQEFCDVPSCPDPPRRRRSHFTETQNNGIYLNVFF